MLPEISGPSLLYDAVTDGAPAANKEFTRVALFATSGAVPRQNFKGGRICSERCRRAPNPIHHGAREIRYRPGAISTEPL